MNAIGTRRPVEKKKNKYSIVLTGRHQTNPGEIGQPEQPHSPIRQTNMTTCGADTMAPLHGILTPKKPKIYYDCAIGTYVDFINDMIILKIVVTSIVYLAKRHPYDASTVVATSFFLFLLFLLNLTPITHNSNPSVMQYVFVLESFHSIIS